MIQANSETDRCRTMFLLVVATVFLGACAGPKPAAAPAETVVDSRAIADETQGANWLSYGRTYAEQ